MAQIRNLQEPTYPLSAKPDYTTYVGYMEDRGWTREPIILDESMTNIVTISGLAAGATGTVIDIGCPIGKKISIMGAGQIPRGADPRIANSLKIILADMNDVEIPILSKIRINKEKVTGGITEAIVLLARLVYADVNDTRIIGKEIKQKTNLELFRFKQSIELGENQHLKIVLVNTESPPTSVDASHIKIELGIDMWYRAEIEDSE